MEETTKQAYIEEIRKLKARYFRLMDTKQWKEYGGLFHEECTFDATQALTDPVTGGGDSLPARMGEPIVGRDAIVAYVSSGLNEQVRSVHQGFMEEIEIESDDRARAIWPMEDLVWFGAERGGFMHGYGHYHETYRRVDGRWYIASLKITRLKVDLEG